MNPPEPPGNASSGLIKMRDRRVLKLDPYVVEETRQLTCCPRQQGRQPARGHRGTETISHRFRGTIHGQMLTTQQIRSQRRHTGPVTGRRGRFRWEHRCRHASAGTFPPLRPMLGDDQVDRWQVKHLPELLTGHWRQGQIITTCLTRFGHMNNDRVRVSPPLQMRPCTALLLTRPKARHLTQRPRLRRRLR